MSWMVWTEYHDCWKCWRQIKGFSLRSLISTMSSALMSVYAELGDVCRSLLEPTLH